MGFTVQNLMGDRAVISGTDITGTTGKVIVDTSQWDYLKARKDFSAATDDFNAAVEAFFQPLIEASETIAESFVKPKDSLEYVVLKDEVEGVEAKPAEIVELTHDSMILRLIEAGDTDRLVWVGENQLEIIAKS